MAATTLTATYRLQLTPAFGFAEAAAVVPYLATLGVSHVYLSPVLQAAPGSTHGYDVVDPTRLSGELGGEQGWAELRGALLEHGLGAVVDIVPNHVAVPAPEYHNPALWSVLRHGRESPYAHWFDVDWEAQGGRILLPVLGAPVADSLDELAVDDSMLCYHDHAFPLAEGTGQLPLPELLDAQHYRLAYWRVGTEEVNYRRFFDIDTLAGVRVEDPAVFAGTHERIVRLVADGDVDGLRVDHPDGLADPRGYLKQLRDKARPPWVVVEKILAPGEELPSGWPCDGTTGYDALHAVGGLFIDPDGQQPLTELHTSLAGAPASFDEVEEASKRLVARDVLPAEVGRLTCLLAAICANEFALHDHARRWLREALVELLVALPVYRAYVRPGEAAPDASVALVERAAATAVARLHRRDAEVELVRDLALGRLGRGRLRDEFVVRFQQTAATVTAKGVEDTAFYRWPRLASLNDVGGAPDRFGAPPREFHQFCRSMGRDWPRTMTTLTTHDTKRAEDVRARLAVLSELPVDWGQAITEWRARLGQGRRGRDGPDPNVEYLCWQTLAGAWPISARRLTAYLEKAAREAKLRTAWTSVNEKYEQDLRDYIMDIYSDDELLGEVAAFVDRIAGYGWCNALAQKLVQLTMPGVPDLYQGAELWSLSLVDPDNRRPVDFADRGDLLTRLDAVESGTAARPAGDGGDGGQGEKGGQGRTTPVAGTTPPAVDGSGAAKLHLVSRVLRLRREHPEWFGSEAGYEPLFASGPAADHVVAFVRAGRAVTVVPRLPARLERAGGWRDTALDLPDGTWTDRLTGHAWSGTVLLGNLLADFPVALLTLE